MFFVCLFLPFSPSFEILWDVQAHLEVSRGGVFQRNGRLKEEGEGGLGALRSVICFMAAREKPSEGFGSRLVQLSLRVLFFCTVLCAF